VRIQIVAKTELGNVFQIKGGDKGCSISRIANIKGEEIPVQAVRCDEIVFNGNTFTGFKDGKPVIETLGKATVTEFKVRY